MTTLSTTTLSTPPTRALVARLGLIALVAVTIGGGGGCATSGGGSGGPAVAAPSGLVVRLDNRGTERLDVYLIQGRSEWHLGRLEPGATASFPLPVLPTVGGDGMARLAVIPGAVRALAASRDARVTSLELPVAELLRQRWTFVSGQLRGL